MFGFLAVKKDDINVLADNLDSAFRIRKALSFIHGTALTTIYIRPFTVTMKHFSTISNLNLTVSILKL